MQDMQATYHLSHYVCQTHWGTNASLISLGASRARDQWPILGDLVPSAVPSMTNYTVLLMLYNCNQDTFTKVLGKEAAVSNCIYRRKPPLLLSTVTK